MTQLFRDAGCSGAALVEQPLKKKRPPNVICTLAGATGSTIIVGAHFDHVTEAGMGAVDDWTGAALLPSLFESLRGQKRSHTFVFVGFSEEERGLLGSEFYAKSLTKDQIKTTKAMINLECLGLGQTNVWVHHADKTLLQNFAGVAQALKIPISGVNVEQVGDSDSSSFKKRRIPTLDIHSVTQETLSILHSPRDTLEVIKLGDYYQAYHLIAAYLAHLDTALQ